MKGLHKLAVSVFALLLLPVFYSPTSQALDLKEFTRQHEKAVVFITTYDAQGRKQGTGSGFFVNPDGDFITNRHVLAQAVSATLETVDGSKFSFGRLLAFKPEFDLAFASIKDAKAPLPCLEIARGYPEKGERAIVFGSPRGVKFSVSEGIVSGIQTFPNAEFPSMPKGTFVQFTAPVSPGSSGGPVLNEAGQVIGVTTWGFVDRGVQNLNFAVPAEAVRELIASQQQQATAAEPVQTPAVPDKSRVAIIVVYGPKLVKEITSQERRNQLTELVEETLASRFKPNRYTVIPIKDTLPLFDTYWKEYDQSTKPPAAEDINKEALVGFGDRHRFDFVLLAGIELVQVKERKADRIIGGVRKTYTFSAVEVELDLRVANVARKNYSYSRILTEESSDVSQRGLFAAANLARPTAAALELMLRSFKREFSADQII